jgi:hypothetical protein
MSRQTVRDILRQKSKKFGQLKSYFEANKTQREQGYAARERHLDKLNKWIVALKDPLRAGNPIFDIS